MITRGDPCLRGHGVPLINLVHPQSFPLVPDTGIPPTDVERRLARPHAEHYNMLNGGML